MGGILSALGPGLPTPVRLPSSQQPRQDQQQQKEKRPPSTSRFFRNLRRKQNDKTAPKLPTVFPQRTCRLRVLKKERILDWLLMEEEFMRNQDLLKPKEVEEAVKKAIDTFRGSPMFVGTVDELMDDDHVIVKGTDNRDWHTRVMSFVDKELIAPNATVLLQKHPKTNFVVGVLEDDGDIVIQKMKIDKKPDESYMDIGGLETEMQELREAVELPLIHPELYQEIGIQPPKGVILYGPPGTGKTLIAKAVAHQTEATFIRATGSELVQREAGAGPKLIRDLFKAADRLSPAIVFLDEIDAIGRKRFDTSCRGEQEVQRTLLELLNQLDGFETLQDVKVILATNRIQDLDPALIRPGRIDRKIEIPLPDEKTRYKIFQMHTERMNLEPGVHGRELCKTELSGAEIKVVCLEAGMMALREKRLKVLQRDFQKALEAVLTKKEDNKDSMYL